MSILLNKDEALRHCGGRIDYHGNSNILPVCQPAPLTGTPTSTSAGGIENPKSSTWKQILLRSWTTTDGGSIGPASNDPGDKGATQQMESHLCVDKCWSSTHDTRMITVESVEHMKSDYDYFRQARHILSQAEGGWLQRKLSWRSYTRVNLSRVRVINFTCRIKIIKNKHCIDQSCSSTSCSTTATKSKPSNSTACRVHKTSAVDTSSSARNEPRSTYRCASTPKSSSRVFGTRNSAAAPGLCSMVFPN